MADLEKLGAFYLGREFDPAQNTLADEPLLYDSRDLTTHAVCVGMTGSGKTGLCIALIEEAAIDGIPSLVIDPKGDLGNLLLAFPELKPADFLPWVDPGEAQRKGLSLDDYAAKLASTWREGLAEWGQDPARIARFRDSVDIAIYTPGSDAGLPLSVLQSFAAPAGAIASDTVALRDRISSAVSGLLGLLGIDADPLKSRDHILLANVFEHAWREGRSLDIAAIIYAIQKPPFDKIGVFDLESFFPAKERLELAMSINNLLASPGFSAWMSGEPLDIQRLLFTPEGKPRLAILSIAHLNDAERMFFVTLALNELIAWMRNQSGTSSLRALLYMDEIFGYFPPTAQPPSKTPMLTLLKQARAFGIGVVLATQNPVDLDYKGLSNAGTWFIGRLQTERDKLRVVEGLESAIAGGANHLDRATIERLLSNLTSRVFLMRNVHDERPLLFKSRWALSYLRGPLTLAEIRTLMDERRRQPQERVTAPVAMPATEASPRGSISRPVVAGDVGEQFLEPAESALGELTYRPMVAGTARLHFVDGKSGTDFWRETTQVAPLSEDGKEALWQEASTIDDLASRVDAKPVAHARFAELPAAAARAASYVGWAKSLASHLYQHGALDLLACDALALSSKPGETEGDFRARLSLALREKRDAEIEKLRAKFAPRLTSLKDQVRRAEERVAREQSQYSHQKMQSAISLSATVLGALLGRRRVSSGTIGRATTAARSAGRIGREHEDVARAEENVDVLKQRVTALIDDCERQVAALQGVLDPQAIAIRAFRLSPRKSDIAVGRVTLLWVPWQAGTDGMTRPAYGPSA
jgi:DNA helicase HerA-like ATPase